MPFQTNAPRKKIAVVGSAGRLGALLCEELAADAEVIPLGRGELDLASPASVSAALEPLDYDRVIVAAALTAVDHCETHALEAFSINAEAPGRIAEISREKGAHVTYISTDFVHDGSKETPYDETDAANPVSVYGASKLQGEQQVLAASADNLVARISWLFGPGKPAFPEWIVNKARAETGLTLPADKTGCPTFSGDLVAWLRALMGTDATPASGIFNLCNSRPCTWLEWGQFCLDTARENGVPLLAGTIAGVPLESVRAFTARRPARSALSTAKFTRHTGIQPRPWQDATREFLQRPFPILT